MGTAPIAPGPVETKVKASTVVAFLVGIVAVALHTFWPAYADLPEYAQTVIGGAIVAVCTFVAGWLARHTPRELAPYVETIAGEVVDDLPDYTGWLKADLRDEARARGLHTSGTKAELVERLEDDDEQKAWADAGAVV